MNLAIEASSPYNDGWTRQHFQNELNKKLKEPEAVEMKKTDRRIELENLFPEALFADGFDEAIMGWEASSCVVVYDYLKCMNILMERDGMSFDEARDFFEFNTAGSWVGEGTPIFLRKMELAEVQELYGD